MSFSKRIASCFVAVSAIALLATACERKQSSHDVWTNYDVRQIQAAPGAVVYQDNDSYYTPPSSYGCSPDDISSIGCE